MIRIERGWVAVVAVLASACGGSAAQELRTADVIQSCVPVGVPLSVGETMTYMAGRYRIVMIADGERQQVVGIVDLEQTPDAYRDWGPATATLSGSAEIDLTAVGAPELRGMKSADPVAPGALVLESRGSAGPSILLRFGEEANRHRGEVAFDGAYAALDVRVIEGDRFAGNWRSGSGIERAEGYFCAQRIEP